MMQRVNYNIDAVCRSAAASAITQTAADRQNLAEAKKRGDSRVALRCRDSHSRHITAMRINRSMVRRPLP